MHNIAELSLQIAKAEFKLKNEGSYLGIFWYLLNPVLTFGLLFFIFSDRLGGAIPHYSLYLLLGIIMFNFFQATTLESTRLLAQENHYLIKSINFPREALVLAVVLKNLLSHFFEVALFCCLLVALHLNILWVLWYIPILVLFSIFIYGAGLVLGILTVFFIDLDNIWNFAVRLIWFGTPLFYAIAGQTRLFYINLANPLYYFITMARDLVIYHTLPELWLIWGTLGWSAVALGGGLFVFGRLNKKVPELI